MTERQIIDANGRFVGNLPPLPPDSETRHYGVIAVVGCQSGGKSTLLNRAFGMNFPVLDAPRSGRRRTTLGVWAGLSTAVSSAPPIIVLDVEGTDSRERGEGAKSFESRTALFALALADTVVVNMWAHDIGRYSAANYELFETVFAHAARLRRSESFMSERTVDILIVIRDHDGESKVSDIKRVLMGDMVNIWESLRISDIKFSSLFNVDVATLPHQIYATEAFNKSVATLGIQIVTPPTSRGKHSRANEKPVPLSGFEALADAVWKAVCSTTGREGSDAFSLDIPRHAALAAYYQCGNIMATVLDGQIGVRIETLRAEIESEWRRPIHDFGVRVDSISRDAFSEYESGTKAYRQSEVSSESVAQRRQELGVELAERILQLRERYLWVCREFCMNGFEDEFRPMLGGTNGYERGARRMANSYVSQYRNLLNGARMPSSLEKYMEKEDPKEEERSEGHVEVLEEFDIVDGSLSDGSDELDGDEYSVERFKADVFRLVEERRRLGELMLPGGSNFVAAGPKPEPWWKGLLIRGAILLINYLQATHGQRAALKLHRKYEQEFPPGPTF